MTWAECTRKFEHPVLDPFHVGRILGIAPEDVSRRLHVIKRAAGLRGESTLICLSDGNVYAWINPNDPVGNLLDEW